MTNEAMFRLIRAQADQPAPRRDTDLDRQFEDLRANDPVFAAYFKSWRVYWSDLKFWCRCVQEGDLPDRPDGVPVAFEQEIVAYYRNLYRF